MQKIVIHQPGGYDRLVLETHADLKPGPEEVLIAVHAAGVNYADIVIRWGLYASAKQLIGYPITPGFEVAGTVVAVGSQVRRFWVGDAVMGIPQFGGYASQVTIPEGRVFPKPRGFSMEEAAGFIAVFLTAYHALFQNIVLRSGMKLLIHSAAGGVGGALVQLGKIAQGECVGVVGSSHKIAAVKALGADHVIDKSQEPLWARAKALAPRGYDVVLDGNGPATLKESFRHLAPMGKLISYGFHSMFPKRGGHLNYLQLAFNYLKIPRFNPVTLGQQNKSIVGFNLSFLFGYQELLEEAMDDLLAWVHQGKIKAPLTTAFAAKDVAKAHQALESGQTIGKLVLRF
jgi:NADPH:quinone reductase-like Zn-dependent oxidoreductase